MEVESIMLREIVRERQIPYDFTHMWNLRNKIDEYMGGGEKREGNKLKKTLFKVYLFILRERERESVQMGKG